MSGKEAESSARRSSGAHSRLMVLALCVAAIVFVIRFIAPQTVGEQVRRHVEGVFREHYPELEISIGRGRLEPGGLILNDVTVSVPIESSNVSESWASSLGKSWGVAGDVSRTLVTVEKIVVVASTDLDRLINKQNPLVTEQLLVQGVRANAWLDDDEQISLQKLWPPPKFGDTGCPKITIVDATLVVDGDDASTRPIEVDFEEAVVVKQEPVPSAINADGQLNTANQPEALTTTISAKGTSTIASRFTVHMTQSGGHCEVRGNVQGARFTSDLIDRLPAGVRSKIRLLRGLELVADTSFGANIRPDAPIDFHARTNLLDGRFLYPQSPMPIQSINGIVTCDSSGVHLESCSGSWGQSRISLRGNIHGYSLPLKADLSASAENLMLDQELAAVLPQRMQANWRRFQPRGLIDVPMARFQIDGETIETTADVTCKGVEINFEKFPYPVQQITGDLRVENYRVKSELMGGRMGGRFMQCLFDMPTREDSTAERVFSIAMDGPIAIDGDLLNALSPRGAAPTKLESFVRSLNPLGAVHLVRATLRTDRDGSKHRDFELRVSDGSLRFDEFAYPLYNVAGAVTVADDVLTLSDFQGSNPNGGLIRCSGRYHLSPADPQVASRQPQLELDFDAQRIALDEALKRSLPSQSRKTWESLAPSGVLDQLLIKLVRPSAGDPLQLTVAGRQYDAKRIGSDTLRLQPQALPYRLDIAEAAVRYEGGEVLIDFIRAVHGQSSVTADGRCAQQDNGRWLLKIDVHNGSRLIADAELTQALPRQMRAAIRGLNLRGAVWLSGVSETLLSSETYPDPVFGWDLQLQLEGNRIGEVGPVHGLRGELSIRGRKDSQGLAANGDVRIDSIHIDELQITQLRGPYQIRDDQLRLGTVSADGVTSIPIEGRLFDGTMRVDGDVVLSDASFKVRLALIGAQMPVLLADLGHGDNDLTGTLIADMSLEGLLGTRDLLRGEGQAAIKDANLYQLPVLVQLLNVLSISPTEEAAFTNAELQFDLNEDQFQFNKLSLWGSLIALHGHGTLDRRHELDLTFNTAVSPRNLFTRVFQQLKDDRYTLLTVDVTGPLENPAIQRRALDNVGQTLERILPGMNNGVESNRKDRSAGIGRMFQ